MNQILYNKKLNLKYRYIFKVQLILSLTIICIIIISLINNDNYNNENILNVINTNIKLKMFYEQKDEVNQKDELYLGRIIIDSIDLDCVVFNKFSDELLKISPCKFYGEDFSSIGNIAIVGHNYDDNRFFGNLNKLEIKDTIKIVDLYNNIYEYIIYDIFETNENDTTVLFKNKDYEITLITCNNSNNKRIIIKAYRKEY